MPKVAIAQIEIDDDIENNVARILRFIDRAHQQDADIVCFPESSLGEDFIDIGSKSIGIIRSRCAEKSIYCIFGCHLHHKGKTFNSAILVNRKGGIQYVYNKRHLFPGLDFCETSAGCGNRVINTDFGKIAIIICWDFAFPEHIRLLSKKGATMIFCPSYLLNEAKITAEVLRSYPLVRAFENLCYFMSCDSFSKEVLSESYICSPLEVQSSIKKREGIIVADIDLDLVDKLRHTYNCLGP